MHNVFVYDPTASDKQSAVRGIGRYLQILKENFPDWIFSSDLPPTTYPLQPIFINPFYNFLNRPLTLKKIAQKQIAIIHDLIPLKYPSHFPAGIRGNINILLNKFALRNYDLIITDSEASKKDIVDILKIKSEKIKVIYPCLPRVFSMKYKVSSIETIKYEILNTRYCLYVGDATWNKNLVNLAQAIKIANVTCVFVGNVFNPLTREHVNRSTNKWLTEFQQFIEETKDDKRFIFPGFISDSELFNLYQHATVNLLLSSDEGFGFSWLEAASFSTPSVLSDIPVLNEISDGNALFADPKNPQIIADKINEIISNKNFRNKIGQDANKRSEFFSAEKFKREIQLTIRS